MCHWILLLPLITLPVFWLMPPEWAIPIYLIIALASGFIYWLIVKSMRKRPETGAESLVGAKAEVVSILRPVDHAQYLVRLYGELWSASCSEILKPGETVNVASVEGIKLLVTRTGVKSNERHCH